MSEYYEIKYYQLFDFLTRQKQVLNLPQKLLENFSLKSSQEVITFERNKILDNFDKMITLNPKFESNKELQIVFNNSPNWVYQKQDVQVQEWHIIFGSSLFLEHASESDQSYQICQQFPLIKELINYLESENKSRNFRILFEYEFKNFYSIFIRNIADYKNTFSNIFSFRTFAMENKDYDQKILKIQISSILNCFLKIQNLSQDKQVTINTGFIGCGVYQNNHILMALLQFLVADLIGINKIVFNTHTKQEYAITAKKIYEMIKDKLKNRKDVNFLSKLLDYLEKVNFQTSRYNTQTDDQVFKAAEKYLYILLESNNEVQNPQNQKYPDLNQNKKQHQISQNQIQYAQNNFQQITPGNYQQEINDKNQLNQFQDKIQYGQNNFQPNINIPGIQQQEMHDIQFQNQIQYGQNNFQPNKIMQVCQEQQIFDLNQNKYQYQQQQQQGFQNNAQNNFQPNKNMQICQEQQMFDLNQYKQQQQQQQQQGFQNNAQINFSQNMQGQQKYEMPISNNGYLSNNNQMMQDENQLQDDHIFLQSRNNQFLQYNGKQQQNINNPSQYSQVKDDLKSLNLNDPDSRMIIQISKLLQTKLKKLHPNKEFLYNRFMHKQLLSQIEQEILYIRCIQNTPYPPDEMLYNLFSAQKTFVEPIQSSYTYEKNSPNQFQWHVNFADTQIFGFYETALFAQDEIQTAENPILYHLREEAVIQSKNNSKLKPLTMEDQNPTPILIVNSIREGKVNTNPTQNNPSGIYGKKFEKTSISKIAEVCEQLKEDDMIDVNLISMCSLSYFTGLYTQDQIKFTFNTAYKSFREAYITVNKMYSNVNIPITINTGNWGTGAFGNHLELIAIIQLLAAEISQIDHLKYFTFDEKGQRGFLKGQQIFQQIKKEVYKLQPKLFSQYVEYFLNEIYKRKYSWQVSDGN
ncbi:hypothetical protein ABPG74_017443 [Tetrahymena malaccensis]